MKKDLKAEQLNKRQIISLLQMRRPKEVKVRNGYSVCPTCGALGHTDYARYCNKCGQRLSWNEFYKLAFLDDYADVIEEAKQSAKKRKEVR